MAKRLYIIDGSSYIYRAFYAVAHLSNSKGLPTNAILGFTRMLLKIVRDESPDYIAVAFDSRGKTFRHEEYSDYKANRSKMPEELVPQIPHIRRVVEALNIRAVQFEGYEADDVIGTLVRKGVEKGLKVTIVSSDKDMMQLISDHTCMLDTMKNKTFGIPEVFEKFGVGPEKVIEIMGLMGDSSDNIPGVKGVGAKTAGELITQFGDIESVIRQSDNIIKKSVREKVKAHKEMALLSRRLVTIQTDIPLQVSIEDLCAGDPDRDKLREFLEEMEFKGLVKEMELSGAEKANGTYEAVFEQVRLEELVKRLQESKGFAVDTETTSIDPLQAEIVGISLSLREGEAYYIPLRHNYPGAPDQLAVDRALALLAPVLEDESIPKYGQNIKYDAIILARAGITLQGPFFDTMVAAYLLDPSATSYRLGEIALRFLNVKATEYKEVAGAKKDFSEVPVDRASDYSCEDADLTFRLTKIFEPLLKKEGLSDLFEQVEGPLIRVLIHLEMAGVRIDAEKLKNMSGHVEKELSLIEADIYNVAGEKFNINSPKQLSHILFDQLKLKSTKKTKTGLSTNVKVLEKLASKHPLPAKILEYRQLMKLKSTYMDALPRMINPQTGRIHTSFNQTVTATGRLSSSNPNLQNIPIRNQTGRDIRKAFIAEPGNLLLSADYSQIELRILAHLSGDPTLIEAFKNGEDIHTRTAIEVFGVLPGTVTPDMRRMAKTVNFGIVYGMSAFGLSEGLGVPRKEASDFIKSYFERYRGVKEYAERIIEEAGEKGYVTTMLRRKRFLPDIKSPNRQVREFTERTAVNTPVQGSAADIIKKAMISIHRKLLQEKLASKMIMQVHDELVFELPASEKEALTEIVRTEMEEAVTLSVPLLVDIHVGKNWDEAH